MGEPDQTSATPSTGPGRLPNFLIVGTAKAGTTTLARWLAMHPDVHVAPEKEVRYFNLHHDRGEAWYRSRFAGATSQRAVGEATPLYISSPQVPARIASLVPDVRLIFLLREPVSRAWSHYWFMRSMAWERQSFERRLADELLDEQTAPPGFSYLSPGCYMAALERFERHFLAESMLVLLLDDLRDDPAGTFAAVCRHLKVDDNHPPPPEAEHVHNASARLRSVRVQLFAERWGLGRRLPALERRISGWNRVHQPYPGIDSDLAARLRAWYRHQNAGLAERLGRELGSWD